MNRALCILLALSMFVPALVPTAAAQTGGEPPVEVEPPVDPEPPSPSLEDQQLGTYFEHGFDTVAPFAAQRLAGDRVGQNLWHTSPLGRNGSMAAALTSAQGLPPGMHQALVSPPIDLTPVPGAEDDGTADRAAELGAGSADAGVRGAGALATTNPTEQTVEPVTGQEAVRAGEVSLPQGPAYLTLIHRFAFDDTTNEQGQAVSGFTIEARAEDGQWTPLEPIAVAETARGTATPSTRQAAGEGIDSATGVTGESVDPCLPADTANSIIPGLVVIGGARPLANVQVPCELTPQRIGQPPGSNDALFTLGNTVDLTPVAAQTDSPIPSLPNAYIQPLDARGYTGDSGDQDEDGRPDLVGHIFDLTPFAGEEVDLRFRAGTSPVGAVPTGLWAIDRAQVRAGARTADLRLQLQAPSEEHLAVPGESFPTQARIQNVGLADQPGPFNVNITVAREGSTLVEKTVTVPGPLTFLEDTTATFPLPATEGAPYSISARLEPSGPDTEPRNDMAAARLPVGEDTSVDLQVIPNATVVQSGDLVEATVIVEAQGNIPITGDVTLTAFPYDPQTRSPVRSGAQPFSQKTLSLPADGDRHPSGVEDAKAAATFERTLEAGSYLLVARFADATAQAPLGVDTAPPPVMVDRFESVTPGETTFEVEGEAGQWQVRPASDVITTPLQLDPGTRDGGEVWAPTEHDASLFRACGDEIIAHGSVPLRELLSSGSDKQPRCDQTSGTRGGQEDGGSAGPGPGDTSALDPVIGFCFLGVGPCLAEEQIRLAREVAGGLVNNTVIENTPPRAGVYLESPEGSQRVFGMAHDVRLDDASRAKLRFISNLITPPGGSGLTEARLYVSTKEDTDSVVGQITDPDNCPEDGPCEIYKRATGPLNLADPLTNAVFELESELRCDAIPNLVGTVPGDDDTEGVEETYRNTVKGLSCPSSTGSSATTGACTGYGGSAIGEAACYSNERSRFEVLMGLLSGDLVWQDTTGNSWEWEEIDLSAYAGQNVTLTFIFLSDTQHTTEHFKVYGLEGNSEYTLGYGAPDRPKGTFLLDRVTVETDKGLRLAPSDTTLASSAAAETAANAAQENRPGTTAEGWRTMGYLRFSGLGPQEMPMRSSAQFLIDDGRPGAAGAEPSQGLSLGVLEGDEVGVRLYSNTSSVDAINDDRARPYDWQTPLADPAVTVLASPEIDLRGLQAPQVQFNQRFDLATESGPQRVIGFMEVGKLATALGLTTEDAAECGIGNGNDADQKVQVDLDRLACMLEQARHQDPELDIQNEVVVPEITSPPMAAGLFLQARTLTDDGWSAPVPLTPEDGYRYPVHDSGAFQPQLNYTVEAKDAYPGYATRDTCQLTLPCNQGTFTQTLLTKHTQQPAWAGDSDVDGDGEADWVTSEVDLSEFEGEVVRVEFVLVARNPSFKDELTTLPWQLDDVTVTEGEVEGQVALHEMTWPSQQLPRFAQGEDLPVRLSVTTPTGLDDEIHARATLVDDEGCFRGTATTSGQFTDAAGRPQPMPAGATMDLPEMIIPGQNVTGASPWNLRIALDTGQVPPKDADATVIAEPFQGEIVEHPFTQALDVSQADGPQERPRVNLTTTDPSCDTEPRLVVVTAPDGTPKIGIDDELDQANLGFQVIGDRLANATGGDLQISNEALSTGQGDDARGLSAVVSLIERYDQRADAATYTLHNGVPDETALVEAPGDRVPVDTPVPIKVRPGVDTEDATLWVVPLNDTSEDAPDAEALWQGSLSAAEAREITVEIPGVGPHMVVLTGSAQPDNEADRTLHPLGGTLVVAVEAQAAGDPTFFDNIATLTAGEGVTEDLIVKRVSVTPTSGLSTEPRRLEAEVQNAGNTVLGDVNVVFTANGDQIKTATLDRMLPGAIARITVPEFEPGGDPAVVIRVKAESSELTASGSAPLRSLIDLGALTPTLTDNSTGWSVSGQSASFEDPETGKAPRDTIGTVGLAGARLEGLADVALSLDHRLDMEQGFDGGQAILTKGDKVDVLRAGPNMQAMGPYSPIQGEACGLESVAQECLALTGQRTNDDEPVQLDTQQFLGGRLETIQDEDAVSTLGSTLFETPEEDLETRVTCQSRVFSDDSLEISQGPRCAWSTPMLPVPREAARDGLWHLQPGSVLSPTGAYNVSVPTDDGTTELTVEADGLTQYLMLEGGSNLVKAAQQEGSLTLTFEEARALQVDNTPNRGTLTIQACARFINLQTPTSDGVYKGTDTSDPDAVVQRCAGLTHDGPQEENLPWSETTLRFGNTPKGDYDIVRFEFSLKEDRGFGGGGILSDETDGSESAAAERLDNLFSGWFIGNVRATAGGVSETWDPDADTLDKTDPRSGLTADELLAKGEDGRFVDVNRQFSFVDATEVRVDGKLTSGVTSLGLPGVDLPLTSCQWWRSADECGSAELWQVYGPSLSPQTQALASIPYALGLSCWKPAEIDITVGEHATACDSRYATGLGPQVVTPGLLQELPPGLEEIPCETGTSETVGQPLFWRTRCLHTARIVDSDDAVPGMDRGDVFECRDPELFRGLRFSTDDMAAQSCDDGAQTGPDEDAGPPIRARGYGLDYRLIFPADLRFVSNQAWATPDLEIPHAAQGNRRLGVSVYAEARIEGTQAWTPLSFCNPEPGGRCLPSWDDDRPAINLTPFMGQRVEIALRVEMPHPSLQYADKSDPEGLLEVHGMEVEGGYVRMVGPELGLRAWTDPSIQGEGWTVNSAQLYGLPIEANVGLSEFSSRLSVRDTFLDGTVLHVHTNSTGVDETLFDPSTNTSLVPATLTLYNQGNEPRTLSLEGDVIDRKGRTNTACQVSIDVLQADGSTRDSVELGPGTSQRLDVRIGFTPEDRDDVTGDDDEAATPEDCFPGEGENKASPNRPPKVDRKNYWSLRINLTSDSIPEGDYVGTDNQMTKLLRATPFVRHPLELDLGTHAPQLHVANLTVSPTRPDPGELVQVTADLTLRDETSRSVDLALQLLEPRERNKVDTAPERLIDTLTGSEADIPVNSLKPYRTQTVRWTLTDVPENLTLVRLVTELDRGQTLRFNQTAWLAKGSVEDDRRRFDATPGSSPADGELGAQQRDSSWSWRSSCGPESCDYTYTIQGSDGAASAAVFSTGWQEMEDTAPPVVSVKARWAFPQTDDPRFVLDDDFGTYARSGWTIQVCHADEPQEGVCPDSVSASTDASDWQTASVTQVPRNTLGILKGGLLHPDACQSGGPTTPDTTAEDAHKCSSAAQPWSGFDLRDNGNTQGGETVVTGTNPGFALDPMEDGAWSTVLASATGCTSGTDLETETCVDWGRPEVRGDVFKFRVVVFTTPEVGIPQTFSIDEMTLAPVGVDMASARSTSGYDIPEAATKAVPFSFDTVGALGARVDPVTAEPDGWQTRFETLETGSSVEEDTQDRFLVKAPISPSGVSQSALLTPKLVLREAPLRNATALVPVGVQAGLHPDLVVTRVSTPEEITKGDDVLVEAHISNQGLSESPPVDVVGAARYSDGSVDLLNTVDDKQLPGLAPGAGATIVLKWRPSKAGNATLRIAADLDRHAPITGAVVRDWGQGDVPELRECTATSCNNVGTQRVEVTPPPVADTRVEARVLADTPLPMGEPVEVEVTVTNDGPATVPAFRVRLLAGVISLLEDDPLVVNEPLAPGETWSQIVELVPGNSGNLTLVATAFSDERLVQEARGLRPDGTLMEADNVETVTVPVVARGLGVDLAEAVKAKDLARSGELAVPINLENRGSEPLVVSVAAKAPKGLGTLVDEAGEVGGTAALEPGQASARELKVLYDELPGSGQHQVDVQIASQAGVEKRTMTVEVPPVVDLDVDPVSVQARAGKVSIPVVLHGQGNAPTTAQISVQSLALTPATAEVEVSPGSTTRTNITAWLTHSLKGPAEGTITVRAGDVVRKAPLRVLQAPGSAPTIQDLRLEPGNTPQAVANVSNLGDQATELNVSLVQGNKSLANTTTRLSPGQASELRLPASPTAGSAELVVEDTVTGEILSRHMRVNDLRPDLHVLELRTRPLAPQAGQTVAVQATLANDGGSPVTVTPGLYVDGTLHTTTAEPQRLAPGAVKQVTFEWDATVGEHTLVVDADPLDEVDDISQEDDAQATEVRVAEASAADDLANKVPGLPIAFIMVALVAVAWARRERTG